MSIYLKKNGYVLINEPETSFFLKFIQILLDDESWSLKAKIFNRQNIFNPKRPVFPNVIAHGNRNAISKSKIMKSIATR